MNRAVFALSLLGVLLGGCSRQSPPPERTLEGVSEHGATAPRAAVLAPSGRGPSTQHVPGASGFLVWESNRSGSWRLWTRDLEGSEPRQLTPDEPKRRHCCAHVAPGGDWVTYLSLPDGKQEYPKGGSSGPLRLIRPDGSETVELVPVARTYFEHRAAVWRSATELIYIDGQGRTALIDVATRKSRLLTDEPLPEYGRLIDSRLQHATGGRADFSSYDQETRRVVLQADMRGCQPYFSHNGRWGFWMAGVGGPISRIDLSSAATSAILHKNDARLPDGFGYLYFPMLSRDGRMLAFSASDGQHDHFRSDYEVFVAEVDPASLELIGDPVRMTESPATDRFPDVWARPLELGRLVVEAPHEVEWRAPDDNAGDWTWRLANGDEARGQSVRETYAEPGRFEVVATARERAVRGQIVVRPAAPPEPLEADVVDQGRRLVIRFDEPLGPRAPKVRLASGTPVGEGSLRDDGRAWQFELGRPLESADTVYVEGAVDLAQRPNVMSPAEIELGPPRWPSSREGLAYLWQTGDAPNLVFDPELESERACVTRPTGRAVLDHDFALVLGRGSFAASEEDAHLVLTALRGANRMSLEAFTTPGATGRLIGMGGFQLNFALRAEAGRLHFTMRHGNRGPNAFQGGRVARYEPGRPQHLVVTYEPGMLRAYVDGESAGEWPMSGDFFNWRTYPLLFGDEVTAAPGETPRLEGVAIYARVLSAEEAHENYLRYSALRARRPTVERVVVEARLTRSSRAPTMQEISPYREALAVSEWEVAEVVEGELERSSVRVAHWVILDGETLPLPAVGSRRRLRLERFDRNPQLEGVYLENALGPGGGSLYYDLD